MKRMGKKERLREEGKAKKGTPKAPLPRPKDDFGLYGPYSPAYREMDAYNVREIESVPAGGGK